MDPSPRMRQNLGQSPPAANHSRPSRPDPTHLNQTLPPSLSHQQQTPHPILFMSRPACPARYQLPPYFPICRRKSQRRPRKRDGLLCLATGPSGKGEKMLRDSPTVSMLLRAPSAEAMRMKRRRPRGRRGGRAILWHPALSLHGLLDRPARGLMKRLRSHRLRPPGLSLVVTGAQPWDLGLQRRRHCGHQRRQELVFASSHRKSSLGSSSFLVCIKFWDPSYAKSPKSRKTRGGWVRGRSHHVMVHHGVVSARSPPPCHGYSQSPSLFCAKWI